MPVGGASCVPSLPTHRHGAGLGTGVSGAVMVPLGSSELETKQALPSGAPQPSLAEAPSGCAVSTPLHVSESAVLVLPRSPWSHSAHTWPPEHLRTHSGILKSQAEETVLPTFQVRTQTNVLLPSAVCAHRRRLSSIKQSRNYS